MAKKNERAEMEARTRELERIAQVDMDNVKLRLRVAELGAEVARSSQLADAERAARLAAEKRLVWIGQLAGSGLHPRQLGE
jgi:hypothetical protein